MWWMRIKMTLEEMSKKCCVEDNITYMPDDVRILYSYAMQIVSVPVDVEARQLIPRDLIQAIFKAEKDGNYQPLREQRDYLIEVSLKL